MKKVTQNIDISGCKEQSLTQHRMTLNNKSTTRTTTACMHLLAYTILKSTCKRKTGILQLILFCLHFLNNADSYIFHIIWEFSQMMDIITNFLCIMLSSAFFSKYYFCICGGLDNCIRSCCSTITNKTSSMETQLSSYMNETSSKETKQEQS